MREYAISGWGFNLQDVSFKEDTCLMSLNRYLRENSENPPQYISLEEAFQYDGCALEHLLLAITEGTAFDYAKAEDDTQYCLIYDIKPYGISFLEFYTSAKTEEEFEEYAWQIFARYVAMSKPEFLKILCDIDDSYFA